MTDARAIFGGLLKGAGQGLQLDAKARLAQEQEQSRADREARRDDRRAKARREEKRLDREAADKRQENLIQANQENVRLRSRLAGQQKRGLIKNIVEAEDGTNYAIMGDGSAKLISVEGQAIKSRKGKSKKGPPADVAAAEWWARNTAEAQNREPTAEDFLDGYDRVKRSRDNPDRFASDVIRLVDIQNRGVQGMRDRRPIQEKLQEAEGILRALQERSRAQSGARTRTQRQPRQEAAEPPPIEQTGPRRSLVGRSQRQQGQAQATQQQPRPEGVTGSGTREEPYRATTQAHVDWFKNSAPKGAILEANGRLFRK